MAFLLLSGREEAVYWREPGQDDTFPLLHLFHAGVHHLLPPRRQPGDGIPSLWRHSGATPIPNLRGFTLNPYHFAFQV